MSHDFSPVAVCPTWRSNANPMEQSPMELITVVTSMVDHLVQTQKDELNKTENLRESSRIPQVLQSNALPLSYMRFIQRTAGFEPATIRMLLGDAGSRTPDFPHAERTRCHCATSPIDAMGVYLNFFGLHNHTIQHRSLSLWHLHFILVLNRYHQHHVLHHGERCSSGGITPSSISTVRRPA